MIINTKLVKVFSLLILNIVATIFWSNTIVYNLETVEAMASNKVPVTIIMYHGILKDPNRSGTYIITPDQFESDIKYLVDNGYNFITMTDLINYTKDMFYTLPDNPVIITFDDGYYNNYVYAYPIIKKYDGKFVLSILGKQTDLNNGETKLSPSYSHVTWENIKEMSDEGYVEIQNHSYDLHDKNKRQGAAKLANESLPNYKQRITNDIMKLQDLLLEKANIRANTFTYPFGKISNDSMDIIKDMGFEASLSCYEGINYIEKGDDEGLFRLKRFNRPYGKTSESFFRNKLINTKSQL